MIRVASAPVSYGAFELTVGVLPNVPGPEEVLDAIAAARFAGTELGPVGYLGEGAVLRRRLESRGLALAGAFVQVRFGEEDLGGLDHVLRVLEGFDAKPVLCDAGPRDGRVPWEPIQRAVDYSRARGFTPTFHHHMGTRVQTVAEIEQLLGHTDVGLLLDTGHLVAGGGDPLLALRDWRDRIDHVHLKDVHLELLRSSAGWDDAWRRGVFCELGSGEVDLDGFLQELRRGDYAGWLVIEQDRIPRRDEDPAEAAAAQVRNRRWLGERWGI